jgi:anti-sigma B factor antagonist
MTGPPPPSEIRESRVGGWLRLSVTGELDLGSSPALEERLAGLRAQKRPVSLDLSRLEFMDSTGLHLLIRAFAEAEADHWELQIERDVSPQVKRLFELVHFDEHLVFNGADLPPTSRGRLRPGSSEAPSAASR